MNTLKEILDHPWNYTVYLFNDTIYVIEISFFEQSVDYTVFYYLTDADITHLDNKIYFDKLADNIKKNRIKFTDREVNNTGIYNVKS